MSLFSDSAFSLSYYYLYSPAYNAMYYGCMSAVSEAEPLLTYGLILLTPVIWYDQYKLVETGFITL
jgi:hypothetical protein